MKQRLDYTTPQVEIVEVAIEQGIASTTYSGGSPFPLPNGWGNEEDL